MQNEGNVTGSAFFNMSEAPQISNNFESALPPASTVLVVSRERDTLILLKTILGIWGYETAEADCLEKSLSIAETCRPGLIILDSILPFETNLENIRQIRRSQFSKGIPLVVLSGFSQPQFKSLSLAVGADGFFVKPLDFDLLEGFLQKIFGKEVKKFN